MISYIHNRILSSKRRSLVRLWQLLVPYLTKIADPEIIVKVGGAKLRMRLSHRLPFNYTLYEYYDRLLPRLCSAVKSKNGSLSVIDVGANIGDTTNIINERVDGRFLCIEPDPEYFSLLKQNTCHNEAIVCVNTAVGDGTASSDTIVMNKEISGSAIIVSGEGISLDILLESHSNFMNADVLKIDTDGYDFTVIRGAAKFLSTKHATLFFEHSPEHCVKVAKEDPMDVFNFLSKIGYSRYAFYDGFGYLIAELSIEERQLIGQLIHYAHITGRYYDILAFHDSNVAFRVEFMAAECEFFPLFNRPYLDRFV